MSNGKNSDIVIEVTADDIALAKPKDSSHCMIADALGRARPDTRFRSVDLATIRWSDPRTGKRYVALTPQIAQQALLDFDQGKKVAPFIFRVRPVQIVSIRNPGSKRAIKPSLSKPSAPGAVPIKKEGRTPPLGSLVGGDSPGMEAAHRTGRIRKFGLRAMGR